MGALVTKVGDFEHARMLIVAYTSESIGFDSDDIHAARASDRFEWLDGWGNGMLLVRLG